MESFYTGLKSTHYFMMLMVLIFTLFNIGIFAYKRYSKEPFGVLEDKVTLLVMILAHTQLVLGFILLAVSPLAENFSEMGSVMKDSYLRLMLIEHPFTMIFGVVMITIGRIKLKKKELDADKYKTAIIFFSIALIFFVARIPWSHING